MAFSRALRDWVRPWARVSAWSRASSLSTAASAALAEQSPPRPLVQLPRGRADTLLNRVLATADPRTPVTPVLDGWVSEDRIVHRSDLMFTVKKLKLLRRYPQALEVSVWMSGQSWFEVTPGDAAYRLELINKVHGIVMAENYFNSLPKKLRVTQTYGALLGCYVEAKSTEKAEKVFDRMLELNMLTTFSYNTLMKLYADLEQRDKAVGMLQAMKAKGLEPNAFTFDILIALYERSCDIKAIDELLDKIKCRKKLVSWHTYAVAAKAYWKAGLRDRALEAIKKSGKLIPEKNERTAYGFLLSLCAEIGDTDGLYRIWDVYRAKEPLSNTVYMTMLSALIKMGDLAAAECVYKEWETRCEFFDFRIPNVLIATYCSRGLVEKAEAMVNELIENGKTPYANTWDRLARGYFNDGQISKALTATKKSLLDSSFVWKPNPDNTAASVEHFGEKGDVEAAEEIAELFQKHWPLTRDIYHRLLRTYMLAGKPVTEVLKRMKKDGFDVDEETSQILGNSSP